MGQWQRFYRYFWPIFTHKQTYREKVTALTSKHTKEEVNWVIIGRPVNPWQATNNKDSKKDDSRTK